MTVKLPRRFYTRRFLNRPRHHSTALILAAVDVTRSEKTRRSPEQIECSAELTLADCSRQITLDLNVWGDSSWGELRNAQAKSRLLRKAFNDFLDAVDVGHKLVEQDKFAREEA